MNGACQAAAKTVKDKFGSVHLLLNAAGVLHVPGKLSPGELQEQPWRSDPGGTAQPQGRLPPQRQA